MPKKQKIPVLTEEQIAAGVTMVHVPPPKEFETEDETEKRVERMARGFILGSQAIGRRREIRKELEERVTKKIGRKGKWLTDKLFELAEGVYVSQKVSGKEIRYYKIPPSLPAITYMIDRVLGKPTQHTEHVEEKRGIMVIEGIIRNLAGVKNEDGQSSKDKRRGGELADPGDRELGRVVREAERAVNTGNDVRVGAEPL